MRAREAAVPGLGIARAPFSPDTERAERESGRDFVGGHRRLARTGFGRRIPTGGCQAPAPAGSVLCRKTPKAPSLGRLHMLFDLSVIC
jgi:hypothetical protein